MGNTFLVITSIAGPDHPGLRQFSEEASEHSLPFILIGDTKSPPEFSLPGCDYYSIERQNKMNLKLAEALPVKHYARKNLGYLIAISKGAEIIVETDDDNLPFNSFWNSRMQKVNAHLLENDGWINIYKLFTKDHIWPRGFALEYIQNELPALGIEKYVECPIQQGLADENPDVDAIYRFTQPLPFTFKPGKNVALGKNSICPFNSQNTTWFRIAFPLLYLPSYCSFRMTDIWRSFVAQRIAWTCGWSILFHQSTVWQKRNDHSLMNDFKDEIPGYLNNVMICQSLVDLNLHDGIDNIPANMILCYRRLIELGLINKLEINLLRAWLLDLETLLALK